MAHEPVVRDFRTRPPRYPDGHWMNRFWGPVTRGVFATIGRLPIYRYLLRPEPGAARVLEGGGPVVLACVHQDIFDCYNGLPRLLPGRPLGAIASYSRDGGLSSTILTALGYRVVRGSSSRGGGEGLLMLRSLLREGATIVMAADGPKAPLGDIKPGVIRLAASAGVPILPVRAWGVARWRFERSWTRAAITIPLSPVVVRVGDPLPVPPDVQDTRLHQLALSRAIARLSVWTARWAGGAAVPPYRPA